MTPRREHLRGISGKRIYVSRDFEVIDVLPSRIERFSG